MRVLFVKGCLPASSPQSGLEHSLLEPLEFEYLAGGIRDHDVRYLDLRRERPGALRVALESFQPHVVGASATTVDVRWVRHLFRQVRSWNPDTLRVVGGYHATHRPQDFAGGHADVIVPGPGELAFRELVDRFGSAGRQFADIPGLALPDGSGGVVHTARRPIPDPDAVAPDRRISAPYRRSYHAQLWMPCALVRNTWGCCYRCSFCALWKTGEGKLHEREPVLLVDELESLDEPYVLFSDDLSFSDDSAPRMRSFCDEAIRRRLRKELYLASRADLVVRHRGLIERLRAAGMSRIFLGLESWNDAEIASWNKHVTARVNSEAVRILHANGVDVTASFVVTPDYTAEQFEALFRYVDSLDLFCPSFLVFTPNPGTDVDRERGYRRIAGDDYDLYDHLHTLFETRLPPDEFYRRFSDLWRRAYSPFRRTGYRRFFRLLSRVSAPLLPHLLRVSLASFRRMEDGTLARER